MQEEIVEPDALITAAHPEMHVHAIYGHTPGQPLIPVDELVVPRCRRDDAVTVARKWMAACGREGNPEPLADIVEPVDHLHQIAPDLMNIGTFAGIDLDCAEVELLRNASQIPSAGQHVLDARREIERLRVDELEFNLHSEGELPTGLEGDQVLATRGRTQRKMLEYAFQRCRAPRIHHA